MKKVEGWQDWAQAPGRVGGSDVTRSMNGRAANTKGGHSSLSSTQQTQTPDLNIP